jgi:ferredoxin-NAD(P)+ reductase (naphthalene dioxygenase ferredoxin-specific)
LSDPLSDPLSDMTPHVIDSEMIETGESGASATLEDGGRFACRIVAVERPARSMTLLRLAVDPPRRFAFAAGQYARVTFPGCPPRDYSLASRPDEDVLEFHIREMNHADGRGQLHERLRPGQETLVEGPFGESFLRLPHDQPILAVAGGSGLAPVKSIVETALRKGFSQPVHLYFGARAEADLYLIEHFDALAERHGNLRFVPVLSEPEPACGRRTGMVSDAIAEDLSGLRGWKAYVYGPPAMAEATWATLLRLDIGGADIHGDIFTPQNP